jgi:hypothetical protein
MDRNEERLNLGTAAIHPNQPLTAGSCSTITFTYTAGHPIDDSGYVKIVFRTVGDFGKPQFEDPSAPNFCSVQTNGDCRVEPRWDPKGHTRPWSQAIYLKISAGFLDEGESIQVIFGEQSGGSTGWQIQTFCEHSFEFKTLVDPFATYQFKELTKSPTLRIVPGKPVKAVYIAPSQVRTGQAFDTYLKLEDCWGNPVGRPQKIRQPGFSKTGIHTLTVEDEATGLSAKSNPIEISGKDPTLRFYWADFHGQTEETVGTNTIEDYFIFARDYSLLDIAAHQGNDFQITDEFWGRINQTTKKFYQPGSFVTFPGFEWSGNTPLGGDRNVYFVAEGGRITRSSTDLLPDSETLFENAPTADDLFLNLKQQSSQEPFTFAHVGGRYADLSTHDPDIELAVEIHSAWGTFEWLLEEAFQRGYRIGICANSDGHKCRPGASYPGAGKFGAYGGMTCVLAHKLNRTHIYKALKSRHFYATTGNRPLMNVRLDSGDGRSSMMGDSIEVRRDEIDGLKLHIRVAGTAPIENVTIRNGTKRIETQRSFGKNELGKRVKVMWGGAAVRGRDRLVSWDGDLHVQGNDILEVAPVNFWNADQPLNFIDANHLSWQSNTTGGKSGVILTLKDASEGLLEIDTTAGSAACEIDTLGIEPKVWTFGGLGKRIEIYKLPDQLPPDELSFTIPLTGLDEGCNPVYIRVQQEDGHMAWSSPIYITISE